MMQLRKADQRELRASTGMPWFQALRQCVEDSKVWTKLAFSDAGRPMMLFGLNKHQGMGIPWMVATDEIFDYKIKLLREGIRIVDGMLEEFPILCNSVDTRNKVHIEWLKWMGFQFPDGAIVWIRGVPFQHFFKKRKE
jgi:hypothetical protein